MVDPCGLWTYFQRYASYYIFYNVEDGVRKINMNILEKPDKWSLFALVYQYCHNKIPQSGLLKR